MDAAAVDLEEIRPDLAEVQRLHFLATTRAVRRPRASGRPGPAHHRENIADLRDPGTFTEYGPTVTAARRRSDTWDTVEERMLRTAADGMVIGVGRVNGELVGPENARCAVVAYDYTVLAGTQGVKNHQKIDRMLRMAERYRLPSCCIPRAAVAARAAAGPADPEGAAGAIGALSTRTWLELGKLSGLVPIVGINSGYCFAGNVVLLGAAT